MKMKLFFTMLFTFFFMVVNAQSINNLNIGKKYTITQIEDSLGTASEKYISEDEFGTTYELIFQNDVFHFDSNVGFSSFSLVSNKFSVNGLFRVGDNISVLSTIPNSRLILKEADLYYLYLGNSDDPVQISFENDVITWIGFMMSV